MNPYLFIFCFLSAVITTNQYCMNEKIPKIYRDLDWKEDIHNLRDNNNNLTQVEFNIYLNQILDYAADQYEEKRNCTLSIENRKKLKIRLYRDTINGK